MARILVVSILGAALLPAQDRPADPLPALQQIADKRAADWETLARGLEGKIARLLPCDPRVRSTIEELARASDARVAALRQYMDAVVAKAKEESDALPRLTENQLRLSTDLNTEREEAEQVRNGIEGQLEELGQSVNKRAALEDAQKSLAGIAGTARQRATDAQVQASRSDSLKTLFQDLNASYQARQRYLEAELAAMTAENQRWSEYYSARLARSLTECTITGGGTSRPPQGKKQ